MSLCRHVHKGVLPYKEDLYPLKQTGVNWPPSKVLKSNHCQAVLKSGKRKGELCGKLCLEDYCPMHFKAIQKQKKEVQKFIKWATKTLANCTEENTIVTNVILCNAIIKSVKEKANYVDVNVKLAKANVVDINYRRYTYILKKSI